MTTRERVNEAFKSLRRKGFVVGLSKEPSRPCGGRRVAWVDNAREAWERDVLVRDLSISYGLGNFDGADAIQTKLMEEVGQEVVAALRAQNLEPEWNGQWYQAIVVRPVAGVDYEVS